MKFNLIPKSDIRKYEASEPSDSIRTKTDKITCASKNNQKKSKSKRFFKRKRELKRRVKQAVQRYIKRALVQRKN